MHKMEKILKANLERGKKWLIAKKKAEFDEDTLTINWINSQDSIMKDIKALEDFEISQKPKKKVKEEKPIKSDKNK